MFLIIFYTLTAVMLGVCIFLFSYRTYRAYKFRREIADKHGFTEGIMTGALYPLLSVSLALLFMQFLSFMVFPPKSELDTCARSALYFLNFAIFFIIRHHTPHLLAYWFGKTAFWDNYGIRGKIPYTEIFCATLSKSVSLPLMNNQRLCKFSFYINKKEAPKRYTCKMTALELEALSRQVEIRQQADAREMKKELIHRHKASLFIPAVKCLFAVSLVLLMFAEGLFFAPRYNAPRKLETLDTVSEITSISMGGDRLCIFYENISAVSVYSESGDHLYSLTLPTKPFAEKAVFTNENEIIYRAANYVYIYELSTGELKDEKPYSEAWEIFSSPAEAHEFTTDGVSVFRADGSALVAREWYIHIFKPVYAKLLLVLAISAMFAINYILKAPEEK